VGRLKRGQTISHEVEPGTHDVKVLFAKTGWQVPNPKTSPTMTYTVGDSETLVPWSTSIHPDQAALLDYPRWGLSSLGCVTGVSPVAVDTGGWAGYVRGMGEVSIKLAGAGTEPRGPAPS